MLDELWVQFALPGLVLGTSLIVYLVLWLGCKTAKHRALYRAIGLIVGFANIAFLPLTKHVLSFLGCSDVRQPEQSYLVMFPYIACGSTRPSDPDELFVGPRTFALALSGTLLFAAGIPLAVLAITLRFRRDMHDRAMRAMFGHLFSAYRPEVYYW